jgi:hypothetical protein
MRKRINDQLMQLLHQGDANFDEMQSMATITAVFVSIVSFIGIVLVPAISSKILLFFLSIGFSPFAVHILFTVGAAAIATLLFFLIRMCAQCPQIIDSIEISEVNKIAKVNEVCEINNKTNELNNDKKVNWKDERKIIQKYFGNMLSEKISPRSCLDKIKEEVEQKEDCILSATFNKFLSDAEDAIKCITLESATAEAVKMCDTMFDEIVENRLIRYRLSLEELLSIAKLRELSEERNSPEMESVLSIISQMQVRLIRGCDGKKYSVAYTAYCTNFDQEYINLHRAEIQEFLRNMLRDEKCQTHSPQLEKILKRSAFHKLTEDIMGSCDMPFDYILRNLLLIRSEHMQNVGSELRCRLRRECVPFIFKFMREVRKLSSVISENYFKEIIQYVKGDDKLKVVCGDAEKIAQNNGDDYVSLELSLFDNKELLNIINDIRKKITTDNQFENIVQNVFSNVLCKGKCMYTLKSKKNMVFRQYYVVNSPINEECEMNKYKDKVEVKTDFGYYIMNHRVYGNILTVKYKRNDGQIAIVITPKKELSNIDEIEVQSMLAEIQKIFRSAHILTKDEKLRKNVSADTLQMLIRFANSPAVNDSNDSNVRSILDALKKYKIVGSVPASDTFTLEMAKSDKKF